MSEQQHEEGGPQPVVIPSEIPEGVPEPSQYPGPLDGDGEPA